MKSWSLHMREGSDSINFDFETNDSRILAGKINSFLGVCGTMTSPDHDATLTDELYCLKEGVQNKLEAVMHSGNDPMEEERLEEVIARINGVINYVESEL